MSGGVGVVGVLTGSWLTAHRDDRRQVREIQQEQGRWDREDERRWVERRRALYAQYLEAVRPWMHHVRHWTGPYWDSGTTKSSLRREEGAFDVSGTSDEVYAFESEISLIGSEAVRKAAEWLHAQLFAFEATVIASGLDEITSIGRYCEQAHIYALWAFRIDLGIPSPEPANKPPTPENVGERDPADEGKSPYASQSLAAPSSDDA